MLKLNLDGSKPDSFVMHESFNSDTDFCIWVPEVDGLQATPFNKHPPGMGELTAKGMDAESWKSWLEKVVLLSDQRLNWRVLDLELEASADLESFTRGIEGISKLYPQYQLPVDRTALSNATRNAKLWER